MRLGVRRVEGAQLAAHLKAAQIVRNCRSSAGPRRAAGSAGTSRRAAGRRRRRPWLQTIRPGPARGQSSGSCQLGHRYGGQLLPHDLPPAGLSSKNTRLSGRILISPGNGVDVAGLWLPVGLEAQEVVRFEHAVRRSKPAFAAASSFLLHTFKSTPMPESFLSSSGTRCRPCLWASHCPARYPRGRRRR